MNTELNGFMLDIRLALAFNPVFEPNLVIKRAASAMVKHGLYTQGDCLRHVIGIRNHKRPYTILKPAIDIHKQYLGF